MKKLLLLLTLALVTPLTFAQNVPSYVPSDGLVGYWPFNGNANDESGNGNNGTVNGATLTTDRNGNSNSAYSFDGSSYIRISNNPAFNFGIGDYSISCWVKKTGTDWLNNIIGKSTTHPRTGLYLGFVYNQIRFISGTNITANSSNGDVIHPTDSDNLYNIVAVFNPSNNLVKLYLNGVLVSSTASNATLLNCDNSDDLMVGVAHLSGDPSGPEYFHGKIDDIGIWNRALTQQEITQLYTTTPAPTEVAIGTQTWTTKNLDVATYSDGTIIPQVTDPTAWASLTTGAWCYYNNDPINGQTYGKLYNWYAVAGIWNEASKTDATQRKKLAPTGYHVPSDSEWSTLTDYLGGASVAGGKMKETGTAHWASPNTDASNSNGFTALSGGYRYNNGTFGSIGNGGSWWSSSELDTTYAWFRHLYYDSGNAYSFNDYKQIGFSVRCVKDITSKPIASNQSFCGATTVASLVATGTDLKWYANVTGGTALGSDVALASGTYYVSQTLNTIESDRTAVVITVNDTQITASANTISIGTAVTLTASSASTGSSTLPANLQNGLVGYWPFNGDANDESSNSNNGTVNGATLTTDRFGNSNEAYSFDGVDDYISIGALNNSSTFSNSFWFNCSNSINVSYPIGLGVNYNNTVDVYKGYGVALSPNEEICGIAPNRVLLFDAITTCGNIVQSNAPFTNNNWYNVVVISDGNSGKIYLNGNFVGYSNSINVLGVLDLVFGKRSDNFAYFTGIIDDVTIYNRVLSPDEIIQLYTQGHTTYTWSTGETTAIINPSPTATTTYWCDVTANGVTCRKEFTVAVRPLAPTATAQTFCGSATVASLAATGTDLKWYAAATEGTALASDAALASGTYYVSQTLNTIESDRTAVVVTVNEAQITSSANTISIGTAVTLTASSASTGSSTLPANLQNGLVGYWPFNGNANDESGNGNNGIVNGATLTTDRFGNANNAYSFDGLSNYIECNSVNLNNTLTTEFWYKNSANIQTNTASGHPPIGAEILGQGTQHLPFVSYSDFAFGISNYGSSINHFAFEFSGPVHPQNTDLVSNNLGLFNQWNHVIVLKNGDFCHYYLNGELQDTFVLNDNLLNTGAPLSIGARLVYNSFQGGNQITNYFKGDIDNVSIWNRALSSQEITQLYTPAPTYLWSTGETTATINPSPTATTTYWCDVTVNGVTCRKEITVTVKLAVISPINYCHKSTAVPLTATPSPSSTLKWYTTTTSKTALSTAPTPLTTSVGSKTYYVSEITAAGVESERLPIVVNINPLPSTPTAIQLTEGSNSITKVGPYIGTITPLTLSTSATNATSFDWILPKGVVVTSALNSSTTDADGVTTANASGNININFSGVTTGLGTLFISVKSVGNCGTSAERKIALTRVIPSTPGTISTTNSNVCFGIVGTANKVTYSIAPVAGAFAQGYAWTVPTGATIETPVANVLTMTYGTEIEVSYDSSFVSGAVSVKASNGVGMSKIKTLSVVRRVPFNIASITGPVTFCANKTATISVPSVAGVTYSWSATNGTSLTAQGNSVTASFANTSSISAYTSVTVNQNNGCGFGASKKITLSRGSCATTKIASQDKTPSQLFTAMAYPNPSSTAFEVTTNTEKAFGVKVYDLLGRLIEEQHTKGATLKIGANYQSGTYILSVSQGENQKTLQVIKK